VSLQISRSTVVYVCQKLSSLANSRPSYGDNIKGVIFCKTWCSSVSVHQHTSLDRISIIFTFKRSNLVIVKLTGGMTKGTQHVKCNTGTDTCVYRYLCVVQQRLCTVRARHWELPGSSAPTSSVGNTGLDPTTHTTPIKTSSRKLAEFPENSLSFPCSEKSLEYSRFSRFVATLPSHKITEG